MYETETVQLDIIENLTVKYPNLYLDDPITSGSDDMHTYEAKFLDLLLERELVVFREPLIEGVDCMPDFFVYNPKSGTGKLVEITLMKKNGNGTDRRTKQRKERQQDNIAQSGIPYVILHREELEKVRDYCRFDLF